MSSTLLMSSSARAQIPHRSALISTASKLQYCIRPCDLRS
jgi:hypothetical protein